MDGAARLECVAALALGGWIAGGEMWLRVLGLLVEMPMIAIPLGAGSFECRAENASCFPSGDQTGCDESESLGVTCRRPNCSCYT
jgi:hypothetical protein